MGYVDRHVKFGLLLRDFSAGKNVLEKDGRISTS